MHVVEDYIDLFVGVCFIGDYFVKEISGFVQEEGGVGV